MRMPTALSRVIKLSVFAVCSIQAHMLFADVIEMTNGDRITGTVDTIDKGKVHVKTDYAGDLALDLKSVKSINSNDPLGVESTAGTRVVGKFSGAAASSATNQVALADIASATRDVPAFETGEGPWTSRADAAANITTGNSDTRAYNLRAEGVKRNRDTRHRLFASLARAEDDGKATKNESNAGYDFNWYFADSWFFVGNLEYFRDTIKDVNYRATAGAGLGYSFYDQPTGRFAVEAGASGVFDDVGDQSDSNVAFRAATHFNQFLTDAFEIYNDNQALVLGDTDRGQIYNALAGLRYRLTESFDASASVNLRYETEPAPGSKKEDLTYLLGLGYRF